VASQKVKVKKKKKKPRMLPNILIFAPLRRSRNAADIIHRAYALYYWRLCRTKRDRLAVIKAFLLSPLQITRDIRHWSGRLGQAAADYGKPLWRQYLEQFYLAFFFSIDLENYYLQEFYRPDGLRRARHFVNKGAIKYGVYNILSTYGKHLHREIPTCSLGRKIEFTEYCRRNKLAVVPVLMQFMNDGRVIDFRQGSDNPGELPEADLFCKPNVANEGEGAEIWFWKGEQGYVNSGGESLTTRKLKERLTALARRHGSQSFLVQPLVLPHPELMPFRKQATPTVRIITYTDSGGEYKVDCAMLRFSRDPASVVDNASAGGMVAPIDKTTGMMGSAVDSGLTRISRRWEQHPDNGAQIKGRLIPYWKESLELVLRAHKLFPHRFVIGWDVLITAGGPLLLEGNSQPGVCFIQKAHLKPLGEMDAGATMAHYSRKALDFLYNGIIGPGDDGKKLDLFNGSSLRRQLNWLLGGRMRAIHLIISGKVQGVYYRKWLQKKARKYRLAGWVRNSFDGTVEAVLKGRAADIEDVVRSTWIGPPRARVSSVKVNWYKEPVGRGFKILATVKSRG